MGLKTFSGDFPVKKDITIAKNYLDEKEVKVLNNIVSGYFDFAEIQAMRHNPMHMSDYVEHLNNVLKATGENVLEGAVIAMIDSNLQREYIKPSEKTFAYKMQGN